MLFRQLQLKQIREGQITRAFRKWKSPRVKTGSLVNTSIGRIEILNISEIGANQITDSQCQQAGYTDKTALLRY